jgi:hypothetical protein
MSNESIMNLIKGLSNEDAVFEAYEALQTLHQSNPESLSSEERNICLIMQWRLEMEQECFNSYYLNFYGDHVEATLTALKLIGSVDYKAVFLESMSVYEDHHVPLEQEDRYDLYEGNEEAYNSVWESQDKAFELCDETIDELIVQYIKANSECFR